MTASLTANELTDMRAEAASSLPDVCTIRDVASVADDMGGYTNTYSDTATNVPCRVKADVLQVTEAIDMAAIKGKNTYTVSLPYNQAISNTSRIVWNGATLEVLAVYDHSWQILKRVACVKR